MALIERVRAIEGANALVNEGAPGASLGLQANSARFSTHRKGRGGRLTVEDLREDVRAYTSLEALAAIMVENPQRARNELRSSCRHDLSEEKWSGFAGAEKRKLTEELIDVVFGMGPIEGLIEDESITEIMINGSQSIYFERDGKLIKSGLTFTSDEQVRVLIDRIIGPLGRRIDESSPMVNARLSQGHRVNAVIPPVSPDGPHITIRAFTRRVFTLEEMEERGSLDGCVRKFLGWLVRSRKNVVVSGGTGSGKTTMLNALSCLITPDERIVTIEDSAELKFQAGLHVVRLEARPRNAEGEGEITIRDLVINALRMRPDRIIVGECRSGEAIDMLQAMNTGHDGSLTTLHANSPEDVVDRMITMVRYAVDLPVDAIEAQIGNAFDYVVQVARSATGERFLETIAEVVYDRHSRTCSIEQVFHRGFFDDVGKWLRKPVVLSELERKQIADDAEVNAWQRLAFGE